MLLLRAVDAVTSVAQAGDDVAVLVQVVVLGAQVDIHIGVSLVQGLDAFRSGDQAVNSRIFRGFNYLPYDFVNGD